MVIDPARHVINKVEIPCKIEPEAIALMQARTKVLGKECVAKSKKHFREDPSGDCVIVKMPAKMPKWHRFIGAARKKLAAKKSSGPLWQVPVGQRPFGRGSDASEGSAAEGEPVNRRTISVGTDCSGMDTPIMALQNLNVKLEHQFSCDINKFSRISIEENFPPKQFYDDLKSRDMSKTPKVDVYVAGFPCQPFSAAGNKQGFDDAHGRGTIFWHVRDYIEKQRPRVFVLENVAGLVKLNEGRYFKAIMESLYALGKRAYNIKAEVLNTKDHGVPQNRGRIYFVGLLKTFDDGTFTWPAPVPRPSIELFLEPRQAKPSEKDLPEETATTAYSNVQSALEEIRFGGHDPLEEPFIVDIDSSAPRMKFLLDITPCLTATRTHGHWVTNRGRRMTKEEMMRLQGMHPSKFKVAIPEAQLGRQIGNAMSVNVLERLFVRLLPAVGLVRHNVLIDRWQSGVPVDMMALKPPAPLDRGMYGCRPTGRQLERRELRTKRLLSMKTKRSTPKSSRRTPLEKPLLALPAPTAPAAPEELQRVEPVLALQALPESAGKQPKMPAVTHIWFRLEPKGKPSRECANRSNVVAAIRTSVFRKPAAGASVVSSLGKRQADKGGGAQAPKRPRGS